MERRKFLTGILGTSILLSMDGFSTIANAIANSNNQENTISPKFASFGAVHLNNTSLEKSTHFWTTIIGMKLRTASDSIAEFGTEDKTLVVVHETAKTGFKKGYSGLYHLAIHVPNKEEFASALNRLIQNKYPISPVDHTMSKSIYLDDPDGINVEIALETPERFKRVITEGGIGMEDTDGTIRGASAQLDLNDVLKHLKNPDANKTIDVGTYIGHLHLYANNVENSNAFYKNMGFNQFNYLPQYRYADVGAGGAYQHRIAMNSWHGENRPLAPSNSAGMNYFQINLTQEKLDQALINIPQYEEKDGGYWFIDPTGNKVFIKLEDAKKEEQLDLQYVVREPKDATNEAPVLMLFHGYGSNEKDIFSIANQVPSDWYVVSVRAPFEMSKGQFKWYDGELTDDKITIDLAMEEKSRTALIQFIDKFALENQVDKNRIVTAGFSQGAGLALTLALMEPEKIQAAACFSGRVMDQVKPSIQKIEGLKSKQVFIGHGTEDQRSPMKYVEEHKLWVEGFGVQVTLNTYKMGHSMSSEEIIEFIAWLKALKV